MTVISDNESIGTIVSRFIVLIKGINSTFSKIVVFAISLFHIWVILVGLSTQGVMLITAPFGISLIFANIVGIWGATPFSFFLPAIISVIFSVNGIPSSWGLSIREMLLLSLEPKNDNESLFDAAMSSCSSGQGICHILRVLVPFYFLFDPEPCVEYAPDEEIQKIAPETDDEIWIHINGIATPRASADMELAKLNELFHRRVYLVHNPCHSIWFDLIECVVGKIGFFRNWIDVEPRRVLKESIVKHIECAHKTGKKRVVLIPHSQGTIIAGNALAELGREKNEDFLLKMKDKLEVYNFATASHQMPDENVKHLENISNKCDLVGWLGMVFPFPAWWPDVDGQTIVIKGNEEFIEQGFWGHLLNTHYLIHFVDTEKEYCKNSALKTYLKIPRKTSNSTYPTEKTGLLQ